MTLDLMMGDLSVYGLRAMPRAAITLRVFVGGMRWRLSETDKVEVWKGTVQMGTLTGGTLTFLVEHLLLTADMVSWVRGTPTPLALEPTTPLSLPAPKAKKPPVKAGPFTSEERTAKAARRRARRKA